MEEKKTKAKGTEELVSKLKQESGKGNAESEEDIISAKIEVEGDVVEPVSEEEITPEEKKRKADVAGWNPKTEIGRKVKSGEIRSAGEILDAGRKILEVEITDAVLPNLESDLLLVGQSKGKFGGGQRRVFKQTQKKTMEGNRPKFGTFAIVGNKDGIVGLGYGKAKETVPAREKAFRDAKLNIIKIRRGCGSWQCGCRTPHTIPFAVQGKCGSVIIRLMPAPKGKGLCVEKECQKMLALAGIKDVWSKTRGQTGSKINLILACFDALKKLMEVKIMPHHTEMLGIMEGESGKVNENGQTE